MTEGVIRRAAVGDAETLSALSAETFSAAFAHLYPPADLAAFLAESYRWSAVGRNWPIRASPPG